MSYLALSGLPPIPLLSIIHNEIRTEPAIPGQAESMERRMSMLLVFQSFFAGKTPHPWQLEIADDIISGEKITRGGIGGIIKNSVPITLPLLSLFLPKHWLKIILMIGSLEVLQKVG